MKMRERVFDGFGVDKGDIWQIIQNLTFGKAWALGVGKMLVHGFGVM